MYVVLYCQSFRGIALSNCTLFPFCLSHVQHIEASLGSKIKGQLDKTDSGVIFTDSYVARYTYMKKLLCYHEWTVV